MSSRNWAEIVARADGPERFRDEAYPVIYAFHTHEFRRGSPVYEPNPRYWTADSYLVTADSDIYTADATGG